MIKLKSSKLAIVPLLLIIICPIVYGIDMQVFMIKGNILSSSPLTDSYLYLKVYHPESGELLVTSNKVKIGSDMNYGMGVSVKDMFNVDITIILESKESTNEFYISEISAWQTRIYDIDLRDKDVPNLIDKGPAISSGGGSGGFRPPVTSEDLIFSEQIKNNDTFRSEKIGENPEYNPNRYYPIDPVEEQPTEIDNNAVKIDVENKGRTIPYPDNSKAVLFNNIVSNPFIIAAVILLALFGLHKSLKRKPHDVDF